MNEQNRAVTVVCGECGTPIHEEPSIAVDRRQACPSCGSKTRLVKLHIQDQIEFHEMLRMEGHEARRKDPFLEVKVGDDLYRKTGEWNRVEQVVDRRNNRYRKCVVDAGTGKTIRHVDEPLTDHQGYGSAKKDRVDAE